MTSWSKTDPRTTELNIYGPVGIQGLIDGFVKLFKPDDLVRNTYKVNIWEIEEDRFEINGHTLDFVSLPPANNHGLKFIINGKTVAITGDTYFQKKEIDFLTNVDLAIVDSGHITDEQIVELAVNSRARIFVCSHLYRELDHAVLTAQLKSRGYEGELIVGSDLRKFSLE